MKRPLGQAVLPKSNKNGDPNYPYWSYRNDDGEIDLTDASLVFRYYTEFDEDIEAMTEAGLVYNIQAADVNGDGEIDLTDASLIFRYYTEFDEDVDAMNEAGLTVLIPSK